MNFSIPMKLWVLPLWLIVSFGVNPSLYAQNQELINVLRADEQGSILHAELLDTREVYRSQAVEFLKRVYDLPKSDELIAYRELVDGQNQVHVRYKHLRNNHIVKGSELIGHFENGFMFGFNGHIYFPDVQQHSLGADEARQLAMNYSGASVFSWQLPEEEAMLKSWKEDESATYFPAGELVYIPKYFSYKNEFALCWRFEINSNEPLIKKDIYVHAQNGEIWAEEDLIHVTDVPGSANTKYRGVKPITTDSVSPGNYRLRESGRGGGIETYDMNQGTNYGAAVDFTDADNYWDNYNAQWDEIGGDAHFGAEMTYDYFKDKFNRNSFDDNGAKIRSYVHYRTNYVNAFWNGAVMTYGDGNGTTISPLVTVDICGHEIAHAVTTNSAGLIYRFESGALNESFSDIFGNAIEYYADSLQFSWRVGEDIMASANGIRNMADPKTHGDPDTYLGTYWYTGTGDNGGVHTNSGVQNFWFYILTNGATGTNDNSDVYQVDSLGINKAEAIAYRNLTVYLTASSPYSDARYYGIRSAADLYGDCSDEVIATTNAWYAVGVGDEYDSSLVIADFRADTTYCYGSELVQFINTSSNAKSYAWKLGDGTTSSATDPAHTYNQQGLFTVELIAESCFYGNFDTMTKTDYILIDSTRDICNSVLMPLGTWDTVYSCNTYVYDHAGEEDYTNLHRDTLTIVYAPSDSAHLTFEEFYYETDWDSIYIYDGYNTSAALIGGYTGATLPNLGNPILLTSGAVTITHFSDPFVVELGFKAHLQAYRPPLALTKTADTLVCFGESILLEADLTGGYSADHAYWWNGVMGDSTLQLTVERDTTIYLRAGDLCLEEFIHDSIVITVRDTLKLDAMSDMTVCYLETIDVIASATGGKPSDYIFNWSPFGTSANPLTVQLTQDTVIGVTVSDGCTQQYDSLSFNVTVRDPISWTKSSDTTICQGGTADFQLDIENGGVRPIWFTSSVNGTAVSSSATQASHSISLGSNLPSGSHQQWITFTDNCTETFDTAFFNLTVRDSLSFTMSVDTTICYGTSASLAVNANGGIANYSYSWDNGLSDNASHVVSPGSTTVYRVQLSDGCSVYEPSDSVVLTVLDSLEVTINGVTTLCYKESSLYSATVTGGIPANYAYNWNSGSGLSSTYNITPTTSPHVVSVQVTDGCTVGTAADQLNVIIRPPLEIDMPNDTAICIGESVWLTPILSGGVGAQHVLNWDQGLGSGAAKQVSPIATTVYTATLSDNCSADTMASVTVTVNPKPQVAFSVSPNPTCTGLEVDFTNTTFQLAGTTYEWNFGDGNTAATENAIHTYNAAGMYNIKFKISTALGCSDSLVMSSPLEIQEHPVASFDHTPLLADFFNPDFNFNNTSQFATMYGWDFGDGGSSSDQHPSYSYSDTGSYLVSLTASNDIGCTDQISKTVIVEDVFIIHIPNAFTPNGDNLNDQFSIYVRGLDSYDMIVFNRWGEILWSKDATSSKWDGTFKGELVPEGTYFYLLNGVNFEGEAVEYSGELMLFR
ncbi:MAG: M4 family metallopeptidase [Bacteroidia bacterium]